MTNTPLTHLEPYNRKAKNWRVVIETPKQSHNKYKFDPELGIFLLSTVMPEGMSFPYDFGFLPSTIGQDGDPLDVLLLMDQPAFCGCVVESRLVGVIEANQTERDGTRQRNDRIVAVPINCRGYSDCVSLKEINEHRLDEIQHFFISYNRARGKTFKVLKIGGPKRAEQCARQGITRAKHKD